MEAVAAIFTPLQALLKEISAKMLGSKKRAIHPLKNFEFLKENLSEKIRFIGLKFSEITEIVMLFQYSEVLFYQLHQIMISIC